MLSWLLSDDQCDTCIFKKNDGAYGNTEKGSMKMLKCIDCGETAFLDHRGVTEYDYE